MVPYQVVLLAGGDQSLLYPLTSASTPKPLLPVANRPLISYALRLLERGGVKSVIIVCEGDGAATQVSSWIETSFETSLQFQVVPVAEGCGSAEAIKVVAEQLKEQTVVVMSADTVTNVSLQELVLTHFVTQAVATVMFTRRRTLASAETKPGKAPKGVDYVGLDPDERQVLYYQPSPESRRELQVPLPLLLAASALRLTTTLQDSRVYCFHTPLLLTVLETHPQYISLQDDVLPHLVRQQLTPPEPKPAITRSVSVSLVAGVDDKGYSQEDMDVLNHAAPCGLGSRAGLPHLQCTLVAPFLIPASAFCRRASDVQAYADINREIAAPELYVALLPGEGAAVHPSVVVGNKSSVAAGCVVGRGSSLGDKCSAKRSVIGSNCKLGNNVKVINSVVMDNVVVEDGCHIQNCILSSNATLQQRCSLKDCQVGQGYVVAEGSELKDEVLAKMRT